MNKNNDYIKTWLDEILAEKTGQNVDDVRRLQSEFVNALTKGVPDLSKDITKTFLKQLGSSIVEDKDLANYFVALSDDSKEWIDLKRQSMDITARLKQELTELEQRKAELEQSKQQEGLVNSEDIDKDLKDTLAQIQMKSDTLCALLCIESSVKDKNLQANLQQHVKMVLFPCAERLDEQSRDLKDRFYLEQEKNDIFVKLADLFRQKNTNSQVFREIEVECYKAEKKYNDRVAEKLAKSVERSMSRVEKCYEQLRLCPEMKEKIKEYNAELKTQARSSFEKAELDYVSTPKRQRRKEHLKKPKQRDYKPQQYNEKNLPDEKIKEFIKGILDGESATVANYNLCLQNYAEAKIEWDNFHIKKEQELQSLQASVERLRETYKAQQAWRKGEIPDRVELVNMDEVKYSGVKKSSAYVADLQNKTGKSADVRGFKYGYLNQPAEKVVNEIKSNRSAQEQDKAEKQQRKGLRERIGEALEQRRSVRAVADRYNEALFELQGYDVPSKSLGDDLSCFRDADAAASPGNLEPSHDEPIVPENELVVPEDEPILPEDLDCQPDAIDNFELMDIE